MNSWEEIEDIETDPCDLEDVTDLIFSATAKLSGLQMLCLPQLEFFDTMSSFEVMDAKMDSRMHRKEALTIKKAIESGILITELTD